VEIVGVDDLWNLIVGLFLLGMTDDPRRGGSLGPLKFLQCGRDTPVFSVI